MGKTLSERVATRAANKKSSRGARNRGAFLALRSAVEQALDDGWPVKTIWETLQEEGKVTCSYQAFRGYTNRLILSRAEAREAAGLGQDGNVLPAQGGPTIHGMRDQKSTPGSIGGFKFESEPNKEDLL
jgi:hypothetical protein